MSEKVDSTDKTSGTEYIVVIRASSSAVFQPEEGAEWLVNAPNLGLDVVRLRAFTRWANESGNQLPRELIIEARGRAESLEEAASKFSKMARPIATMAGFVANVRVGRMEVHLAYDCSPSSVDREFVETFLPDERGMVAPGRMIKRHLLESSCAAFFTLATDAPRINRALRQYELALREWYVGGEWLALNHLWIAAENLTPAVIRKTISDRGISEEDLAHEYGLVTDDPDRPRWRDLLGALVRARIIFAGDRETYKAAKDASDGLEHGFWELDKIAQTALKSADNTFQYIRQTITGLLGVSAEIAAELNEIKPKDVQSFRKVARGRLVGSAEDPAMNGQLYPLIEWTSGVGSVDREGSTFHMHQRERMTVRTHPDIGFRLERLEVHGRLEDGTAPVRLSDEEVAIVHEPSSASHRLLESVMPLIDAAAASGADVGHTRASMFAFNMFGQAVAFFQSVQVLVAARLPVEALPALRGLAIVAARFEQMAAKDGAGLGIAVRAVLDACDASDADADRIETTRQEVISSVVPEGVTIPDKLAPPETTSIYASIRMEMKMAAETANGTYSTVPLHMERVDATHAGFMVQLEPGPLTDLVSTAAVIAMLELVKLAGAQFGWTIPTARVDQTLAEAVAANDAAAQLDLFPSGATDGPEAS